MAKKTPTNPYGLTIKERKWLKVYIETGNATEGARQAFDCKSEEAYGTRGSQMLKKLAIPVAELLDEMGLSDGRLHLLLEDGLVAMKTEIGRKDGKIIDRQEFIDWTTRAKYLELAYRVKGKLINRVAHEDADGNVVGPVMLPAIPKKQQPEPVAAAAAVPGPGDEATA